MRVVFYPTDDESNTWIFDFPGGEDGEVELPENDYRVICFNYDTDGMVWKENGSYTLFTADTRDVRSPDNRTMAVTPPWLCGDIGLSFKCGMSKRIESAYNLIP